MNDELKEKLVENSLSEYIDLLEKQKVNTEELLSELTQYDFEKIGITIVGDQKKFLKLFPKNDTNETKISNLPVIYNYEGKYEEKRERETKPIIITNTSDSGNAAHTGLAGLIGGILGAAAVITFILIIISNELSNL